MMMGPYANQAEIWVDPLNLFQRSPEGHRLRKLNAILDLGFVGEEVVKTYGRRGHVSVDPVQIMKMRLLLFLNDVKSERELMRQIPLRIDSLYFLGDHLEDVLPQHSVLSKARKRWGVEIFAERFRRTVEQAVRAGLVDRRLLHVDSSLVRADAWLNSVVQVTLAKLDEPEGPCQKEPGEDRPGGPMNREHPSTTDAEAAVVRHGSWKSVPGSKVHRAGDDQSGIMTAVGTTTEAVDEGSRMLGLVEQHQGLSGVGCENNKRRPG